MPTLVVERPHVLDAQGDFGLVQTVAVQQVDLLGLAIGHVPLADLHGGGVQVLIAGDRVPVVVFRFVRGDLQRTADEALQASDPRRAEETPGHCVADRCRLPMFVADRVAQEQDGNTFDHDQLGRACVCRLLQFDQAQTLAALDDFVTQLLLAGWRLAGIQLAQVWKIPAFPEDVPLRIEVDQEVVIPVAQHLGVDIVRTVEPAGRVLGEPVGVLREGQGAQHIEAASGETVDLQGQVVGLIDELGIVVAVETGHQQRVGERLDGQQRREHQRH
ncbi:hypothetical protein D3C78_1050720 [compost metagenome]